MTTYQPMSRLTVPLACAIARDIAIVLAAAAYVVDKL